MTRQRKGSQKWIAILAVCVLSLHTLVVGFVDGAMAAPPSHDGFGGVICSHPGTDHEPAGGSDPHGHSPLPPCCLAGCNLVAGHATVPAGPALSPNSAAVSIPADRPAWDVPHIARSAYAPFNPRAPPQAA